jgi:arylsulfatase A-like enzyme
VRRTSRWYLGWTIAACAACSGAGPSNTAPNAIRLVDLFDAKRVEGVAQSRPTVSRTEFRFDGPATAAAPTPATPAPGTPAVGTPTAAASKFAATYGWQAGPGVEGLAVREGRLVGRSTTDAPIIYLERTSGFEAPDSLHAVEIRMRASAGANIGMQGGAGATFNPAPLPDQARAGFWPLVSPMQAGDEFQTYLMTPLQPMPLSRTRYLAIRPSDAAGATFAIESVRLITRREHLASIPAGVGWQGLREIYRETLVSHAPETMNFDVTLPDRPSLDLAVGTVEDGPVTFLVKVRPQGATDAGSGIEVAYTVTQPYRWERYPIDLTTLAGRPVTLSLQLQSEAQNAVGFWGAPVVRTLQAVPATGQRSAAPRGVILIQADTLRRDHLSFYGHSRETAPVLTRMANEGVRFNHAISNGSWTKVSTPSIMTSLYPSTHGIKLLSDRLPSAATTLAEAYRAAGYATMSLSSVPFTGQYTNLHQGFEVLHEAASLSVAGTALSAKTGREYVDRLLAWLDDHREAPFFVYLHVFDPHSPYEPYAPYNTKWSEPARMEEHRRHATEVVKVIEDPFFRGLRLPTRAEVVKAGFDPDKYIEQELNWYDGSIRGMDAEMGRLFDHLKRLGLDEHTLVVLTSDHGTEFHDHGRIFHGHTVYGELINIPLVMRWPARIPAGRAIDDLVQSIDIMPTMLDLTGLAHPQGLQGQSLQPFLAPAPAGAASAPASAGGSWPGWTSRPTISERVPNMPTPRPDNNRESVAIIDGTWKLIHNTARPPDLPEFELFDYAKDPLNKQNVAADHPEVVARLSKAIAGWRQMATAARLKPDAESTKGLSAEELQRLRSLGYVR